MNWYKQNQIERERRSMNWWQRNNGWVLDIVAIVVLISLGVIAVYKCSQCEKAKQVQGVKR